MKAPSKPLHDINELMRARPNGKKVGIDGLPFVGEFLKDGDAKLHYMDNMIGQERSKYYKDQERSQVDSVIIAASRDSRNDYVNVKLRYNRNPVVGDKFSSRHGQKGVLSILWPQVDMPFSESGIVPDIIINPNAFPSRMTIGMLMESMTGKALALEGTRHFVSPFDVCNTSYTKEVLRKHGFNSFGNECLYSGVFGVPLKVEIFQGIVYYQRLRHMVKDKA